MTGSLILDTHIFLWFSEYNPRLLQRSLQNIIDAKDKDGVALSAISVWEIAYLQAKNKIKLDRPFNEWLSDATRGITIIPICADIAIESASLPDCNHRDPADRFIIATARVRGGQILTYDQKILDYSAKGYVNAIGEK